ncbi:hypothetical protein DBV14_26605 [Variovorax sp. KBW07]|nr:hypothetical protein DBV14_26605 [Variovorax sp. KBW07]
MREEEIAGQQFESSFTIDRHTRLKFVAKVALSAGQFIYGDLFRQHVRHNELRATMNLTPSTPRETFAGFETLGYDEFSPVADGDAKQVVLDRFLCETVKGSCVMAIPGPRNLGFVVGVLGKWTGTLNVPAVTDTFPSLDDHDLGHVITLVDGKMERLSYRAFVGRARPIQDAAALDAQDTSA